MSVFGDSSAMVKLYGDEPGSSVVRAFEAMQVSQLCRVEVPAAIWRKTRMGVPAAECETMAVFDRELRDAAAREGFTLVPVLG